MRCRRLAFRGFTLVEMLVVVVIMGTLLLMTMPRIERAMVARDLHGAKSGINAMLLRAKAAAVQLRRPVTLSIASDRAILSTITSSGTTQYLAFLDLRSTFAVTTTATATALTVQPTGLVVSGTPFVVRVSKGSRMDSVQVTGYGRIE